MVCRSGSSFCRFSPCRPSFMNQFQHREPQDFDMTDVKRLIFQIRNAVLCVLHSTAVKKLFRTHAGPPLLDAGNFDCPELPEIMCGSLQHLSGEICLGKAVAFLRNYRSQESCPARTLQNLIRRSDLKSDRN